MKSDNLLILGALGIGGYLIYKSNIAKGLGDIAGGAGSAAQGLGSGIGEIGMSAGDIAGSFASGVNSVLALLNPLGELGVGIAQNIQTQSEIRNTNLKREAEQSEQIDTQSFEQTNPELTNLQSQKDIFSAQQDVQRSKDWEITKTSVSSSAENLIKEWASAGSSLISFNPANTLSSFIQSISSISSLKKPVSEQKTSQIIINQNTSQTSGGGASGTTSTKQTSIKDPFAPYLPPIPVTPLTPYLTAPTTSIRKPTSTKKWYNPLSWF